MKKSEVLVALALPLAQSTSVLSKAILEIQECDQDNFDPKQVYALMHGNSTNVVDSAESQTAATDTPDDAEDEAAAKKAEAARKRREAAAKKKAEEEAAKKAAEEDDEDAESDEKPSDDDDDLAAQLDATARRVSKMIKEEAVDREAVTEYLMETFKTKAIRSLTAAKHKKLVAWLDEQEDQF